MFTFSYIIIHYSPSLIYEILITVIFLMYTFGKYILLCFYFLTYTSLQVTLPASSCPRLKYIVTLCYQNPYEWCIRYWLEDCGKSTAYSATDPWATDLMTIHVTDAGEVCVWWTICPPLDKHSEPWASYRLACHKCRKYWWVKKMPYIWFAVNTACDVIIC